MLARVKSGALKGVDAYLVEVEVGLAEFLKSSLQGPVSVGASIHLGDQEEKEIGPSVMGGPATLPGGPVKE